MSCCIICWAHSAYIFSHVSQVNMKGKKATGMVCQSYIVLLSKVHDHAVDMAVLDLLE